MDNGGEGVLPVDSNDGAQPSTLNISDVLDAIVTTDPRFGAEIEMSQPPAPAPHRRPYVRIAEQPASKALRFRYPCEGRSAGSIPGVNSTSDRKTYPTIEICGHKGQAVVVVSCVTREEPYKPHPHYLVGRERCENGVCTIKTVVSEDNPQVSFSNLGIQCVKRKDIADSLKIREKLKVDPFRTGFGHRSQPQSIDLNAVRLCFQVFLQDDSGRIRHSLPPVVSDVIYDKKAMSDLTIMRISQCTGSAKGGTDMILLCEKVTREDIAVVFYQKDGERVVWEECANVVLVHKQVAIVFNLPPYHKPLIAEPQQVYLQLKRISDNARSNSVAFEYMPDYQDPNYLKRKRMKTLSPFVHSIDSDRAFDQQIKSEPRDKTPPHQMGSSPLRPLYEQEQMQENNPLWGGQNLNMPGPSLMSYASDLQWGQSYMHNMQPMSQNINMSPNLQQMTNLQNMQGMASNMASMQAVSPNMQAMSQNMQAMSPNMQAMSPNMQARSPNMQAMSPNMQAMSPNAQAMSPNVHAMSQMSPNMGHVSPAMGHVSPGMGHVSPGMGHVSPGMGHISPNLAQQQQMQQDLMESGVSDTPSISALLIQENMQLYSGDLPSLPLADRGNDLSDSLNRLSTSDLLYP